MTRRYLVEIVDFVVKARTERKKYTVSKKHPKHFQFQLEQKLSDSHNFQCEYS